MSDQKQQSKDPCVVIYEVNIEIDGDSADELRAWLLDEGNHIQEMLSFDGFLDATLYTRKPEEDNQNQDAYFTRFTICYRVNTREDLENYFKMHAQRMREEGVQRFPNKFRASRRILYQDTTMVAIQKRSRQRTPSEDDRDKHPDPNVQAYLEVTLNKATGLLPADLNGSSDPFVTCRAMFKGKCVYEVNTPVVNKSVDPEYDFEIKIPQGLVKRGRVTSLEFEVWDKDTLRNDFLGVATVILGKDVLDGDESCPFRTGSTVELKSSDSFPRVHAQGQLHLTIKFLSARNAAKLGAQ